MTAEPVTLSNPEPAADWNFVPLRTLPRTRALAWSDNLLYVSQGYTVRRGSFQDVQVDWQMVGQYNPPAWRQLTNKIPLAHRLVRDGFHALAALPSGHLVGAVPGAIVVRLPGASEFLSTHTIKRGTRPLHIVATPVGKLFWGEYFDNPTRDEVHIYGSADCGASWQVAYTFPKGAIRHVHNIVHDQFEDCLWILTGDYGPECQILRASCDLTNVEAVLAGNQQARAVALVPAKDALYFASDTPLEVNHVYRLDRDGKLQELSKLSGSSIYGCQVGDHMFFSTMVEPSEVNTDRYARVYGKLAGRDWRSFLAWKKDRWPTRFFQYGNAILPDGRNRTDCLAVSTIAVENADLTTTVFRVA
jgi:hypothetical protein